MSNAHAAAGMGPGLVGLEMSFARKTREDSGPEREIVVTFQLGGASDGAPTTKETYTRLEGVSPLLALSSLTEHGRDLLRRTAELPETEQGLLSVLAEYRYAVFTFVSVADRL